jgi:hypothetical protein
MTEYIMGQQSNSPCRYCQSENQNTFSGELALHFRGLDGLNKPIVWVFQDVSVCLDCGYSQFPVPERELEVLRTKAPVERVAVWLDGKTDDEKSEG